MVFKGLVSLKKMLRVRTREGKPILTVKTVFSMFWKRLLRSDLFRSSSYHFTTR